MRGTANPYANNDHGAPKLVSAHQRYSWQVHNGVLMFLLNNIHNRDYESVYGKVERVRFDLADSQLCNAKNSDWELIHEGAIVCVVTSSMKMSTFCRVERKFETDVPDENGSLQHVIVGPVVAKLKPESDMTAVLSRFHVSNKYLPGNKFSIGFNVADLGDQLASLGVWDGGRTITIGELEAAARDEGGPR